jgi:hypothetical protein
MYAYRDFVIKALSEDLPFDRFVQLQLAADLMIADGSHAATGFLTCGPFNTNSPKEIDRYDELDDLITTTGHAFLGLNLGCARCHDHKYDPITQVEYYRLLAAFNSSQRADRPTWTKAESARANEERLVRIDALDISAEDRELLKRPLDRLNPRQLELHTKYRLLLEPSKSPQEHVLMETPGVKGGSVGTSVFLERGNIEAKRQPLTVGFLHAVTRAPDAEQFWLRKGKVHPRRALADWLVDVDHGAGVLTARVIVNRLWHHHFGAGLVRTPNDFGLQGDAHTHPDLLEWLAGELIRQNWHLHPIHRLILRSATYRQASTFDPAKADVDVDNRLVWRYVPRRLDGEAIRDSILAVSGGLDRTMFGPAVHPYIPREAILPAAYTAWLNSESDDPKTWRRSIYTFVKRSTPIPMLQAFDRPDRTISNGKRHVTTIVPQALHFVNDPLVRTQCEVFAERIVKEASTEPKARIRHAYRLAIGRQPRDEELTLLRDFLHSATLTDLCQSLFMLNEFTVVE